MELLDPPTPPSDERTLAQRIGLAVRRLGITAVGAVVVLAGLVMLVTPGPGLLTLAAGLAILATEYAWAHHLLQRLRARSREVYERARARRHASHDGPSRDGA